jgi:hypothetical protein
LDSANIDAFLASPEEAAILVYSSVMCQRCDDVLNAFERVANTSSEYLRFARLDVAVNAHLAKRLKVRDMPTLVYWKNVSGKVKTDYIPRLIQDTEEGLKFITSHWSAHIEYIKTGGGLTRFLTRNPGIPKIIQLVKRSAGTLQYQKLASDYDGIANFAVIDAEKFPGHEFPIPYYPSWVVYRHLGIPYRMETTISGVRLNMQNWSIPTMAELHRYNYDELCHDFCVVRIGAGDAKVIRDLEKVNISTFWINSGRAASNLGARTGNWVVLKPRNGTFLKLKVKKRNEVSNLLNALAKMRVRGFKNLPRGFKLDWQFRLWLGQVGSAIANLYAWIDLIVLDGILVVVLIGWLVHSYIRKLREPPVEVPTRLEKVVDKGEKAK